MSTPHLSLHRHVLKLWLATVVAWCAGDVNLGAQHSAPVHGIALDAWVFKDPTRYDQTHYVIEDDIMRTAPTRAQEPAAAHTRPTPSRTFAEPTFTLFPVPAQTFINIKSPMSDLQTIQILSNDGRILLQQQVTATPESQLTLNIGQLPQGIYHLQLIDQRQQCQSRTFIKR